MWDILFIIIGFVFLTKGADVLVDGSTSIARRFKVSDLVIGLTIVAFGTSAPELVVNMVSSFQGSSGIAVGNVLGSNIFNILLILGASALFIPLKVTKGTVWKEIPFAILAALVLGVVASDSLFDGTPSVISRTDGIVFIAFFLIYIRHMVTIARDGDGVADVPQKTMKTPKSIAYIAFGLVGLVLGGKLLVDGAIGIARLAGVSETLIGLTIVAVGTSLPELATSIVAARKKNPYIAVGNIVGSNIFNIFLILGISAGITPLPFQNSAEIDVLITIAITVALFVALLRGHLLRRAHGILFILMYLIYFAFVLWRG